MGLTNLNSGIYYILKGTKVIKMDRFTFVAYAFRVLKDTDLFNDFDRILIHKVMTKGNALLSKEEEEKFDFLALKAYRKMLNLDDPKEKE